MLIHTSQLVLKKELDVLFIESIISGNSSFTRGSTSNVKLMKLEKWGVSVLSEHDEVNKNTRRNTKCILLIIKGLKSQTNSLQKSHLLF